MAEVKVKVDPVETKPKVDPVETKPESEDYSQRFKALKKCYTPSGAFVEEGQEFSCMVSGYIDGSTGKYVCPPYLEEVD